MASARVCVVTRSLTLRIDFSCCRHYTTRSRPVPASKDKVKRENNEEEEICARTDRVGHEEKLV
jgi:hypothetical protein